MALHSGPCPNRQAFCQLPISQFFIHPTEIEGQANDSASRQFFSKPGKDSRPSTAFRALNDSQRLLVFDQKEKSTDGLKMHGTVKEPLWSYLLPEHFGRSFVSGNRIFIARRCALHDPATVTIGRFSVSGSNNSRQSEAGSGLANGNSAVPCDFGGLTVASASRAIRFSRFLSTSVHGSQFHV